MFICVLYYDECEEEGIVREGEERCTLHPCHCHCKFCIRYAYIRVGIMPEILGIQARIQCEV